MVGRGIGVRTLTQIVLFMRKWDKVNLKVRPKLKLPKGLCCMIVFLFGLFIVDEAKF